MGVIMSKEFHRSIDIDGSLKAKAWDFITKLNLNADLTGLDVKIPKGPSDKRVRTARVDQSVRAVLFAVADEPEPMWLLAAIRPHDQAYEEAQSLVLDVNPANGAMEVTRPTRISERVGEYRRKPIEADAPQILPFTAEELVGLGIIADVAEQAVRLSSDDDLLTLAGELPTWQQQALLDLATGTSLDDVRRAYELDTPVGSDDPLEAVQRATSRMEFVYLSDDDELRRMLEGDFAAWRTYLHPTQRDVAYRPLYRGPFRLAGGAGTGKTVVALHRAAFLAQQEPEARVLLCTFTRNLAAQLAVDIRGLLGPGELGRVDVLGVDQVVRSIVAAVDGPPGQPLDDREQDGLWREAVGAAGVPAGLASRLDPSFLGTEYRAVVLALPDHTREAYLRAGRTGRGLRLNRVERAGVWRVVEAFERAVESGGRPTYDALAGRAARLLHEGAALNVPHYDHVVVDEGQDLHAGHWRVLRGLVGGGPNDLFICEDGHQRIYGERVVLSHFGIETRGRSRRLTLNYRTTRQNLRFAMGVLGDESVVDLDGEAETVHGYRSTFAGPDPELRGFGTDGEESTFLAQLVRTWLDGGTPPAAIAVLSRRHQEQERARLALDEAGVPVELLAREGASRPDAVKVASMHRAKGTEFERVVVMGAEAGVVPLDWVVQGRPEPEYTAALGRERSLFYVACSRARDQLVVTWTRAPSPFLPISQPSGPNPI